jgi:hypothetical protein
MDLPGILARPLPGVPCLMQGHEEKNQESFKEMPGITCFCGVKLAHSLLHLPDFDHGA